MNHRTLGKTLLIVVIVLAVLFAAHQLQLGPALIDALKDLHK